MGYRVAVLGASGAVGRAMLSILAERSFPVQDMVALASSRSVGRALSFGADDVLQVQDAQTYDFKGTDFVFASAGGKVSEALAPKAAAAGAVVIDNSSHFRNDPEVPLVVPEVNPQALDAPLAKGIVANPNCSTIQMVVALKPLHDCAQIKRVVVATYQSVSGSGHRGIRELEAQLRALSQAKDFSCQVFPKPIAHNAIPHIDVFEDDGSTREERKISRETRKIMHADIAVMATCVRIPTFIGHGLAVNLECAKPLTLSQARAALEKAPGIEVIDRRVDGGYVTPVDCVGSDEVFVSRLRRDPSVPQGLSFWCVADNLRKGAALNAVQIGELLIARA